MNKPADSHQCVAEKGDFKEIHAMAFLYIGHTTFSFHVSRFSPPRLKEERDLTPNRIHLMILFIPFRSPTQPRLLPSYSLLCCAPPTVAPMPVNGCSATYRSRSKTGSRHPRALTRSSLDLSSSNLSAISVQTLITGWATSNKKTQVINQPTQPVNHGSSTHTHTKQKYKV